MGSNSVALELKLEPPQDGAWNALETRLHPDVEHKS